jgi:hypothetical protein
MLNNTLVHYGYLQNEELNLVKKLAKEYNLEFRHDGVKKLSLMNPKFPNRSFATFAHTSKYANFMVIWGGNQCYAPLVTKLCEAKGIPKIYIEWGMLPQRDHFFIDPYGFCGDSILNKNLDWINNDDINLLYNKREELQKKYIIENQDYIFVPLQLNNDSQVLYYTKYKNMNEFINDLVIMYPDDKIVLKVHPKAGVEPHALFDSLNENIKSKNIVIMDKDQDFLQLASKAKLVVGLTSTTLYESAILGKNVISMGNHPLNTFKNNIDKVLAGALFLNIDRKYGDIKPILDRFNLYPLK